MELPVLVLPLCGSELVCNLPVPCLGNKSSSTVDGLAGLRDCRLYKAAHWVWLSDSVNIS